MTLPLALAATSPLLAWRDPVYQISGFAGILGMGLMLVQPLLAGGYLAGISLRNSRRLHRLSGQLLVFCVVTHVVTLWITTPPDVIDALLFASPTPFSVWGVIAMWAVFAAALLAFFRYRLPIRIWRLAHTGLVCVAVIGTVVHAVLIEGTMEPISKILLCILVLAAAGKVIYDLKAWAVWRRR